MKEMRPEPQKIGYFAHLNEFSISLYELGREMLGELDLHKNSALDIVAGCLFMRMLNTYRSGQLLMEQRLYGDARMILRHFSDTMFLMKACVDDREVLVAYLRSGGMKKLNLDDIVLGDADAMIEESLDEEEAVELRGVFTKDGIAPGGVEVLATRAGLRDYYETAYGFMSHALTLGTKTIEDYVGIDEAGRPTSINYHPYGAEAPALYVSLFEVMVLGLISVNATFGLEESERLYMLKSRLVAIADNHGILLSPPLI